MTTGKNLEQFAQRVTKSGLHLAKCFHFQVVLFLFSLDAPFVLRLSSPENSGIRRDGGSSQAVCEMEELEL